MKAIITILSAWFLLNPIIGQDVMMLSPELNKYQNLRDFCISAQEDEAYFTIQSPNQDLSQIVCVKNYEWNKPELLTFCDAYSYLEPFLSRDGNRLYFASDRPKKETDSTKSDFDIWYVERKNNISNWSLPINMGVPVNSVNDEFYPTLSDNGNLYFTMDAKTGLGKDDIYFCKFNGEEYAPPMLLNNHINSEGYEFNAFVAKDESYIIYTRYNTADGFGSGDLYIAKKDEHGEWKASENMGAIINTKYMEYCPFYDQNTHTLYFTSRRSKLIPQKFKDVYSYLETISGSENGLSKLYKINVHLSK